MTLALTLGMSVGLRQTFYMMWGELLGVAIVAISAVLGVAALMLNFPQLFVALKLLGGAYLIWIGIQLWRNRGKLALEHANQSKQTSKRALFSQGLITAVANPKGWAFTASLLPPFINANITLAPQLTALVIILLISEFICMMIYASGGHGLKRLLKNQQNVTLINRISGALMIGVGCWLAVS